MRDVIAQVLALIVAIPSFAIINYVGGGTALDLGLEFPVLTFVELYIVVLGVIYFGYQLTVVIKEDSGTGLSSLFEGKNRMPIVFGACIIIFMACLILQWIPVFAIKGRIEQLGQLNLTTDQTWVLVGSLDWWISTFFGLFKPLSYLLFVIGIIIFGFLIASLYVDNFHFPRTFRLNR